MGDRYLAGLWESDLPRQLLSERDYFANEPATRSSACQAPSWSWASISGLIFFRPLDTERLARDFGFLGSELENVYGEVQSGTLRFKARLRSAQGEPSDFDMVRCASRGKLSGIMIRDAMEPEYTTHDIVEVFLLAICSNSVQPASRGRRHQQGGTDLRGLVLRNVGPQKYSRLGVFLLKHDSFESSLSRTEEPVWKSYDEQLDWFDEGEVEKFELI